MRRWRLSWFRVQSLDLGQWHLLWDSMDGFAEESLTWISLKYTHWWRLASEHPVDNRRRGDGRCVAVRKRQVLCTFGRKTLWRVY
jgi:hypothetical protein